ncbi:MAG: P-II family nitrogen regulator [Clostridia bacterium]|nr:P-II family nitrogen regulator [Clostridia bacterium]MDR3643575.1 P-II family nitrogen regulator [Clostridia bacterium]
MKKIEAIIRPEKVEDIKEELNKLNVNGLTLSQVMGCGQQKGWKEYFRGTEVILSVLPKVKAEIIVTDAQLEAVIEVICKAAHTGELGDGKIFVYDVVDAIRIRTGERGIGAV